MNEETFNKFVKQVQDEMEALEDKPTIGEIRDVSDLPLIVYPTTGTTTRITVEAEKTCRTCQHWDYITDWIQDRADPHDGTCRLITNDARNKAAIYAPDCRDKPQLWTEADFSCNQWQPRPDADARHD